MTVDLYNPPYALWTLWHALSTLNRGFVVILGVVFAYCVFSTIRTMARLRTVWKRPDQNNESALDAIGALACRHARLQQVISATFYVFGLVFFLGLESLTNVAPQILVTQCAFAANIFFALLVLHSIQWAGTAVLDSLSKQVTRRA